MAAFEIMIANPAIRNLIREGKTHQIQTVIQTGSTVGMLTMDASLLDLYKKRLIDLPTLKKYAIDVELLMKQIQYST